MSVFNLPALSLSSMMSTRNQFYKKQQSFSASTAEETNISTSQADESFEDDDYGFYDISETSPDEDFCPMLTPRETIASCVDSSSSNEVLCEIEDKKAPVSCRSFGKSESSNGISVFTSIIGLRVVQDDCGEVAEYKVRLIVDMEEFIAWRRFSDFKSLGDACLNFTINRIHHFDEFMKNPNPLKNTNQAWQRVERNRPCLSRNISLTFLIEESGLLENFVKNLLFEVPSVDMLLEFIKD